MSAWGIATPQQELRQRTKKFAVRIMTLCDSLPPKPSARVIGNQLLRSGTSIGANYRSAQRGRSKAEFVAKLGIVVEEADETQYWLELLLEAGIVPAARLDAIIREAAELTAIFTRSKETARGR